MKTILIAVFALLPALAAEHHIVYKEAGRFGGWPANHGIWSWGDEIVVGFRAAYFKAERDRHAMDRERPQGDYLARSLDGGRTWRVETPPQLTPPEYGGPASSDSPGGFDFTAPGFALTFRYGAGPEARFYVSTDRCRTWRGPYKFPLLGQPRVMARTDYQVLSKREMLVFLTVAKGAGREGRVLCARTTDGAKTWAFVSWIGPEPGGFSIMPSTVRLGPRELLTAVRRHEESGNWIETWRSRDNGLSWEAGVRAVPSTGEKNGNPPSLLRLKDGTLVVTYARRAEPFAILARASKDNGKSWSDEITVRAGGGNWDLGYTRTVQRADGKLVTVYYFNDHADAERYIAASVWQP